MRRKNPTSVFRRLFTRRALAALLLGGFALLSLWCLSAALRVYPWTRTPLPSSWSVRDNFIEAHSRPPKHRWAPAPHISSHLRAAVVAGEDVGFFWHSGLALGDLWLAAKEGMRTGKLRGASSITQQLAKNLFWSRERSWLRKLDEPMLVVWLEHWLSKHEILNIYLNIVELGPGVFGAEAGARHYFNTSARDLSADQAMALAASIPSPRRANPQTQSKGYQARLRAISERLARMPQIVKAAR